MLPTAVAASHSWYICWHYSDCCTLTYNLHRLSCFDGATPTNATTWTRWSSCRSESWQFVAIFNLHNWGWTLASNLKAEFKKTKILFTFYLNTFHSNVDNLDYWLTSLWEDDYSTTKLVFFSQILERIRKRLRLNCKSWTHDNKHQASKTLWMFSAITFFNNAATELKFTQTFYWIWNMCIILSGLSVDIPHVLFIVFDIKVSKNSAKVESG